LEYAVTEIIDSGTSVFVLPSACKPTTLNTVILEAYKTEKFLEDLINNRLDLKKITKVDELYTLASFMDEEKTIELFYKNVFSQLNKTQLASVLDSYIKKGNGAFVKKYSTEFMGKISPFFGSLDEKRRNVSANLDVALHEAALDYIKSQDMSKTKPSTIEILDNLQFEEVSEKTGWAAIKSDRFSLQKNRKRLNPIKCLTEAAGQGVDVLEFIEDMLGKEDPAQSGANAINSLFGGD
jgi:hypothetical protein